MELDAPKIQYHDAVADSSNLKTVGEVGKKYGVGRNKLFKLLRELKVLMADQYNSPYQRYIDSGYFVVVGNVSTTPYGTTRTNRTMVTGKGEIYIGKLLHRADWPMQKQAA
ncbi:Phage antirepressor protein KilAC domain protein [compost metagenome]